MPRYLYYCRGCAKEMTRQHLSDEHEDICPVCGAEEGFNKLLTRFTTGTKTSQRKNTGQITEEFIDQARQDLAEQKQDISQKTK
tara:strand:+ start:301 stop:552 length:252 start_codon:yes stop_codon:yes gene_type:complete